MIKPRIIGVHLLNDFSGSPFVFSQALQACQQDGYEVHLLTATPSGKGFLSGFSVVEHPIFYKWSRNKWLTLIYFLSSQFLLFLKVMAVAQKQDIVYINTMLPFGAALAAKIKGAKVVYHIHEVSVQPVFLKKFLLAVVRHTAVQCIYVSEYVRTNTSLDIPDIVVYNALPLGFVEKAEAYKESLGPGFMVLMLCSLKIYKGILEFLACAEFLPDINFELVLNASQSEIDVFFADRIIPENLKLFPAQSDVHPFYSRASIVMNLSLPDKWIETFGMTALEAMYYGKPVIVPPVGGIVELVQNGLTGYCIEATNTDLICMRIHSLEQDKALYEKMSKAALERAKLFNQYEFGSSIVHVLAIVAKEAQSPLFTDF